MFSFQIGEVSPSTSVDWLEFAASFTSSLAWPLTLASIAIIFRQPITDLMNKLRKAAVGGVSIELDSAEELVSLDDDAEIAVNQQANDEKRASLDLPPDYIITTEWRAIELILKSKARRHSLPDGLAIARIIQSLQKINAIQQRTVLLLHDLRSIRNRVAHSDADVSQTEALRFLDLAHLVRAELRSNDRFSS